MKKKIIVIGAGFSGICAAAYLADKGYEVCVYEKNKQIGGRARALRTPNGYTFDMGPSWYWMPDVFDAFFSDLGYDRKDLYQLTRLDPAFDIVLPSFQRQSIPGYPDELIEMFEKTEVGAGKRLQKFMQGAKYKYEVGMKKLVHLPGISITELLDGQLIKGLFKLQVFQSFRSHVKKYFQHPSLTALMEFPVLFLGAKPQDTPALYSLMNYAGLMLGTYYPENGFAGIIDHMQQVAQNKGVVFYSDSPVQKIITLENKVKGIDINGTFVACDALLSTADYHYTEQYLLEPAYRNYSAAYWKKKIFAPSCLIYYLGVQKKINKLSHHTLFFEEDLEAHARAIYDDKTWPDKPLFYVCCTSKTDANVAPKGHENIFLLMPIATGLEDSPALREHYFGIMMRRLERYAGETIEPYIDYKKSYCVEDFTNDYHAYQGNAYGLANTLLQTAHLKPSMRNKKLSNLFYAGQLTVPGPGVPPAIISGKVAANLIDKTLRAVRR